MIDTIRRFMAGISDGKEREALRTPLEAIGDRLASQTIHSAALVIFGASSALAKTGAAATPVLANGVLLSVAAATNMAALSGTTAQNTFNVYCFYIDSAAVLTSAMGTSGTTLALVKFPQTPVGKAMIGFITVNPTSAAFIGGTTFLDAASTNVVYVNTIGSIDPTVLVS